MEALIKELEGCVAQKIASSREIYKGHDKIKGEIAKIVTARTILTIVK